MLGCPLGEIRRTDKIYYCTIKHVETMTVDVNTVRNNNKEVSLSLYDGKRLTILSPY